jgi:hypothetical protein
MRIGRNLTITDIDTYITNYVSNYHLTEEQINQMIANASGAIGCLSYLVGVGSNKLPLAYLKAYQQAIPNNSYTPITWEEATIDNLLAFDPNNPQNVKVDYSGAYTATLRVRWSFSAVGSRAVYAPADMIPYLWDYTAAELGIVKDNWVSGAFLIKGNSPFIIYIKQTTGNSLNTVDADLVIHREGFITYP